MGRQDVVAEVIDQLLASPYAVRMNNYAVVKAVLGRLTQLWQGRSVVSFPQLKPGSFPTAKNLCLSGRAVSNAPGTHWLSHSTVSYHLSCPVLLGNIMHCMHGATLPVAICQSLTLVD